MASLQPGEMDDWKEGLKFQLNLAEIILKDPDKEFANQLAKDWFQNIDSVGSTVDLKDLLDFVGSEKSVFVSANIELPGWLSFDLYLGGLIQKDSATLSKR